MKVPHSTFTLTSGLILQSAFFLQACAGSFYQPIVTIEPIVEKSPELPLVDQRRKLLELAKGKADVEIAIRDIVAAMDAAIAEENAEWEIASERWLQVITGDTSGLAGIALLRWIKVQEKLGPDSVRADSLAHFLLSQTNQAQNSAYLLREGLSDLRKLTEKIRSIQHPESTRMLAFATNPGDLRDYALWKNIEKSGCKNDLPEIWKRWVNSLEGSFLGYWNGIQAACHGDYSTSMSDLMAAIASFKANRKTLSLAVSAAEQLISVSKSLGDRRETTKAYQVFSELLDRPEIKASDLGWNPFQLTRKRIETWFWVARNQALQADYEGAKRSVSRAFDIINEADRKLERLKNSQKNQLTELRAEGFQILAARIAYEQRELVTSLELNASAQQLLGLSSEWQYRLLWAESWYAYSLGDRSRSVSVWKEMLNKVTDNSQKPRLYYWLSRASSELGNSTDAELYSERLLKEYPLNYYSVVGLKRLKGQSVLSDYFKDRGFLEQRLSFRREFNWGNYIRDQEAVRRVLRFEYMLAAGATRWIDQLGSDLFRYISSRPALMKESEPTIYVSRLLHQAGRSFQAISLTTQLMSEERDLWRQNPEQILVFFPRPHLPIYEKFSTQFAISPELSLAISRQESSFKADAVSPVEALGLMQLMRQTAQSEASRVGLPLSSPEIQLKEPDINIQIGSAYLARLGRRYESQWPYAFSAYNAGEFATDAWIARRPAADTVLWTEMISFAETSGYVKNVWRNWEVYRWLFGRVEEGGPSFSVGQAANSLLPAETP